MLKKEVLTISGLLLSILFSIFASLVNFNSVSVVGSPVKYRILIAFKSAVQDATLLMATLQGAMVYGWNEDNFSINKSVR